MSCATCDQHSTEEAHHLCIETSTLLSLGRPAVQHLLMSQKTAGSSGDPDQMLHRLFTLEQAPVSHGPLKVLTCAR